MRLPVVFGVSPEYTSAKPEVELIFTIALVKKIALMSNISKNGKRYDVELER